MQPYRKPRSRVGRTEDGYSTNLATVVVCLFITVLFASIVTIVILVVPSYYTDPYVTVHHTHGILDDDDHHHHHYIARDAPPPAGMRAVDMGGDHYEVLVRMPYPRGVDEQLLDPKAQKCGNYSLYTCGKWQGGITPSGKTFVDRAFDAAGHSALQRLEVVMQVESMQYDADGTRDERSLGAGGAYHDLTLSCIASAAYPDEQSDIDYAHATLREFQPPGEVAEGTSQTALGGYALATAIVYGDQPGVSMSFAMNPRNTTETIVEWALSSQTPAMLLIDDAARASLLQSSCAMLISVELFPWNLWNNGGECVAALESIISSLIAESQRAQKDSEAMTWDYISHRMEADIHTPGEWANLVGGAFANGYDMGLQAAMHTFEQVMEDEGMAMPVVTEFRQWTRYPSLLQFIGRMAARPEFVHFVRAMFVANNYNYESAILHGNTLTARSLTRGTHGLGAQPNMAMYRFAKPHLLKKQVPAHHLAARTAVREQSEQLLGDDPLAMSALIRSDLWRRCAWLNMEYMPAEIDNAVARSAITGSAKARVHELVDWIVLAIAEDVEASARLSDESKGFVLEKLSHIRARVAVPWDWDGEPPKSVPYQVDAGAPFVRNARGMRKRDMFQSIVEGARNHGRAPTERPSLSHTFDMRTSEINAYYDPTSNQIFFLAGILQPPFFSMHYSDATQLATLGAIIGHELGHAFDSMGKNFKSDGSLGAALDAGLEQNYAEAEECFVEQYSKYPTPNGNRVDGRQTLGENMADVMGLRFAYRALWNLNNGRVPADEKQEFVEAYAQMWCSAAGRKEEADRAQYDVHAPGAARIQGALRNLVDPEGKHVLSQVYECATGTDMHPETLCSVW